MTRYDQEIRSQEVSVARGKVRCCCGGATGYATFEVIGTNLIMTSEFGVAKVAAGLGPPRRLAKRLLKNMCTQAMAKTAPIAPRQALSPPAPRRRADDR